MHSSLRHFPEFIYTQSAYQRKETSSVSHIKGGSNESQKKRSIGYDRKMNSTGNVCVTPTLTPPTKKIMTEPLHRHSLLHCLQGTTWVCSVDTLMALLSFWRLSKIPLSQHGLAYSIAVENCFCHQLYPD